MKKTKKEIPSKLRYEVACPRCGKIFKGHRKRGAIIKLAFLCKGKYMVQSSGKNFTCGQKFWIRFFDEESKEEKIKAAWLSGELDGPYEDHT